MHAHCKLTIIKDLRKLKELSFQLQDICFVDIIVTCRPGEALKAYFSVRAVTKYK